MVAATGLCKHVCVCVVLWTHCKTQLCRCLCAYVHVHACMCVWVCKCVMRASVCMHVDQAHALQQVFTWVCACLVQGCVVQGAGGPFFSAISTSTGDLLLFTPAGRRMLPPIQLGCAAVVMAGELSIADSCHHGR